ncbi:hypothetical protein AVEN_69536-1, partial [Araneus ventricosus]
MGSRGNLPQDKTLHRPARQRCVRADAHRHRRRAGRRGITIPHKGKAKIFGRR